MRSRIVTVLAVGCAACQGWSHKDTVLEASFVAATTLDWQQTVGITESCAEVNPIIGACGQRVPVGFYFPVLLAAHAAISAVLPASWRGTWQGFTIGMESTTAYWNTRQHR
jgi:hypothetical protein